MGLICDYCDRPATWHSGRKTATMPGPSFAYACDEHHFEGMVSIETPLEESSDGLSSREGAEKPPGGWMDREDYDRITNGLAQLAEAAEPQRGGDALNLAEYMLDSVPESDALYPVLQAVQGLLWTIGESWPARDGRYLRVGRLGTAIPRRGLKAT
jgi:hypothetical protein